MIRAVLTALVLLTSSGAQQLPQTDVPAVPVEQEPRHRLVFVNDFVRIIDAFLPPLYVSQNHTHSYDNVAVTILPGIEGARGQARVGFAGFSRGGYTHVITNPNTAPMRIVDVELRAADRSGGGDDAPLEGHAAVLNNTRVRVSRVRLAAGESLADHRHAAGYVSVVVRGAEAPGTWRWHPSGDTTPLAAGRQPLEIVEIEPK